MPHLTQGVYVSHTHLTYWNQCVLIGADMANSANIPVRLTPEDLERFDQLAAMLSERAGGLKVSRSELMRMVFQRGIPVLEAELGAPLNTPTSTTTAPTKRAKGKR